MPKYLFNLIRGKSVELHSGDILNINHDLTLTKGEDSVRNYAITNEPNAFGSNTVGIKPKRKKRAKERKPRKERVQHATSSIYYERTNSKAQGCKMFLTHENIIDINIQSDRVVIEFLCPFCSNHMKWHRQMGNAGENRDKKVICDCRLEWSIEIKAKANRKY